jgi:2-keto-4-pentenoate hydratase/2-oxohepta-3-ene-1,7-dioic acid hydratase in catechol pathway
MTRRDLQGEAKKVGRQREVAKSFDGSAPISEITSPQGVGPVQPGERIRAAIEHLGELNLQVCKPS